MGKFGFSFSWRRALGLSAAKARLSRRIGIPLTQAGRERKIGRAVGSAGLVPLLLTTGRSPLGCLGSLVKLVILVGLIVGGVTAYRHFSASSAGRSSAPSSAPSATSPPVQHEPTFDEILKQNSQQPAPH